MADERPPESEPETEAQTAAVETVPPVAVAHELDFRAGRVTGEDRGGEAEGRRLAGGRNCQQGERHSRAGKK